MSWRACREPGMPGSVGWGGNLGATGVVDVTRPGANLNRGMELFDRLHEVATLRGRTETEPLAGRPSSLRARPGSRWPVAGPRCLAAPVEAGREVGRGRPGLVRRIVTLLLSLVPGTVPMVAPLLEAAEPPRARVILSDTHPPERCPHVHHPHYLCLQVQQLLAWPAAGPGAPPALLFGAPEAVSPVPDPVTADRGLAFAARAPPLG